LNNRILFELEQKLTLHQGVLHQGAKRAYTLMFNKYGVDILLAAEMAGYDNATRLNLLFETFDEDVSKVWTALIPERLNMGRYVSERELVASADYDVIAALEMTNGTYSDLSPRGEMVYNKIKGRYS
jgi:hypothetical protein